jgi:hypothetical protein
VSVVGNTVTALALSHRAEETENETRNCEPGSGVR